ncbi:Outward-rectifier potassium channel TOK1 [Yarrowia sp. B02]|nr:Outward-rectifier potassium channel TOK1 [Yarrowia sp. B02]
MGKLHPLHRKPKEEHLKVDPGHKDYKKGLHDREAVGGTNYKIAKKNFKKKHEGHHHHLPHHLHHHVNTTDPNELADTQETLMSLKQVTNTKDIDALDYLNNLEVSVGSSGFATWYMISSSFPLIAAAIGPLANMCAIAALTEAWLEYRDGNIPEPDGGTLYNTIKDPAWVTALNAVSLGFGVTANISMLLNFAGRINYTASQVISICGFGCAAIMLLVLAMVTKFVLLEDDMQLSASYWHGIMTFSCYMACSILLFCNEFGHLLGFYGATFNLNQAQRGLMLQNISLAVWTASGAGLFQYLMDLSYPDALYFCHVSILTIGLGDIHPIGNLERALIIPYALIGTLMLGLIITSIRSMIIDSSSKTLAWNHAERNRKKKYHELLEETVGPEKEQELFEKMRQFHDEAEKYRTWLNLTVAIFTFGAFLCLGAMCFKFVEHWSYWTAVYFCLLCLTTIGYGDVYPQSSVGKAFFIVWSMAAVPMMTILISSMGDTVIAKVVQFTDVFGDWALAFPSLNPYSHNPPPSDPEKGEGDGTVTDSENGGTKDEAKDVEKDPAVQRKISELEKDINTIRDLAKALNDVFSNSIEDPLRKYSFEEWREMMHLVGRVPHLIGAGELNRSEVAQYNHEFWAQTRGHSQEPEDTAAPSAAPANAQPRNDSTEDVEDEIGEIASMLEQEREDELVENAKLEHNLKKSGISPLHFDDFPEHVDTASLVMPARVRFEEGGNNNLAFLAPKKIDSRPQFWLSDSSPLRFPVRENRVFLKKYINALDETARTMLERYCHEDPGPDLIKENGPDGNCSCESLNENSRSTDVGEEDAPKDANNVPASDVGGKE